ncbi:uroporphyrinogen decarboxylase [Luteimonas cucumeris]|uniref:Uroporphyrinogen decarboxylase n=1 Tax=Luteimonas cucumeris TaxID=985012 RepID=A0A562KYC6_9GAMM|nr:uroporphyrinogen decarboxylase [Luteimonas cucumeris]TWI00357.1 uroporphyrinogen decarboxylase [Luteimonas cucumeris]
MTDATTPKNDRLLRALRREPVDCTPVWLMRQAGRYLPEYRATRQRAGSFLGMAKNPDIACEVTVQPLARFDLDAAILFSDILTIPDAMGLELYFVEGEGPKFRHPVRDAASIAKLAVPDMETELRYVMDAIRTIRRELDNRVPLIGFSGSPWTLACYMVEGGGSDNYSRIKALALNDPKALHQLLSVNTDAVIAYLSAQRAAGAQVLQVFDTWGGVLSPSMYREFSLPYLTRIAHELQRGVLRQAQDERGLGQAQVLRQTQDERDHGTPLILFGKGNAPYLEALAASGAEGVGVDWLVELSEAARRTQGKVALQGNLDPAILYGSPDAIRAQVRNTLDSYAEGNGGSREGHVFNLGHGLSPDMDPEHVRALVDAVHEFSRR